jgi:hypothetical protein
VLQQTDRSGLKRKGEGRRGTVFHKLILETNKTLNILYEKKELKLKFPSLDEELNKLEYLLLAFSIGITYYGRLD